jgi:1-aminocyclopropane-1-carboxylate deaminase/D-cysteine desulfhydrase-like pyridoxal-dependent ACC family enzyme
MADRNFLKDRFPELSSRLPHIELASLPTPVTSHRVDFDASNRQLSIKHDNLTGSIYGGNKLRKLEYILALAKRKRCSRVATFGAAGSNHALATALYARDQGLDCTCFLSHQSKTGEVAATLNKHIECGTEIVRFGGAYSTRIETLRRHLHGRNAWVIPMGGSSWLGNIGFVAAGLELASQVERGEVAAPDCIYVGSGTMGTAVGLAIGLAAAELDTEVHAVRVSDVSIMNREKLDRLLAKTVMMMRRCDETVPADLAVHTNIRIRDDFFGPGYAKGTERTFEAIRFAKEAFDLTLEPTYTGKAMSALLNDWRDAGEFNALYWHTYNSVPLDVPTDKPLDPAALPEEFLRYFES